MNKRLLFLAILLWLAFLFPSGLAADSTVDISTLAVFKRDEDTMWRCYANITIQNNYSGNLTLMWTSVLYMNVTFVDETFEQLTGVAGHNITLDPPLVLKPKDKFVFGIVATDSGFVREPRIIWIYLSSSFFEAMSPLDAVLSLVPEFPSLLVLPLLMIATLLTIIVYRRKPAARA
jgi:hypothetical protein